MIKAGAIGRLGDVTKLLQTPKRRSSVAYAGFCQRGSLPSYLPFPRSHSVGVGGPGYYPGKFLKSTASQNCRAAAVGKQESRAIAGRTARCRCKFRWV